MIYFVSLGSNLGNGTRNLAGAVRLLREGGVEVLAASSLYRTEPVDHPDQPWFMNQVLEISCSLDPPALLKLAKSIEAAMGRVPTVAKGPRTIDIDILLAGDLVMDTRDLAIPHRRLALRNFVLIPLVEIAPKVVHPVLKKTIAALLRDSDDPARVEEAGRRPRQGKAAPGR